jgi:hypothetical protein
LPLIGTYAEHWLERKGELDFSRNRAPLTGNDARPRHRFGGHSSRKIDEKPQKSLWILLDFLVRIERFQGVALTPRPKNL